MGQQDVGSITQHPKRHVAIIVVLDLHVEDKRGATFFLEFHHQIRAALFDPLVFGL
uniref:Uncharacterized protein n=1 Tax=Candidatus Kentrum sp. DK TaxID=2126562 RepID=A0A450T2Z2_9GAMM|nr:MAG: hypothetical protein BECKDK2373C_GA0170839_10852 [Candidatus Kentron sp. DK]